MPGIEWNKKTLLLGYSKTLMKEIFAKLIKVEVWYYFNPKFELNEMRVIGFEIYLFLRILQRFGVTSRALASSSAACCSY